ncbi:hypothetical protein LWI28_000488 [Acer negundo]|uniref:Late embryogenesis abundant protein LEA-2 subgroup domain-containing protein n=1 Tax=Acer negundo TaxID=4023 RepID=A0AAD5IK45_ACENE|nr:hypothetical protein LWI28_000488 [Acer negundo]KAK4842649.1 hypothetical protein QYF36_025408 [Acer negundo]
MPLHSETNPHFDPSRKPGQGAATPRHRDQRNRPPASRASQPQRRDQQNRPPGSTLETVPLERGQSPWFSGDQHNRRLGPLEMEPLEPGRSPWYSGWQEPQHDDQQTQPLNSPAPRTKKPRRQDQRNQPLGLWPTIGDQPIQPSGRQAPKPKEALPQQPQALEPAHQGQHPQAESHKVLQPVHQGQRRQPPSQEASQPQHNVHNPRQHRLWAPSPRRTKLLTWFLAAFCTIFWIVIILGGIVVLIVYLVFRPHNPQFDVAAVTLNAAYLDMDVLLNADLTVLANFTNPNKKVKVDFSYVVLDLYYGSTFIASQYVEPFSAPRTEYKLLDIHLVTSQVRLPVAEIQRLKKEISNNAVVFKIKGVFRARSNLGGLLRYSYRLYGTCLVMLNGPPTGVIRGKKCKTKR